MLKKCNFLLDFIYHKFNTIFELKKFGFWHRYCLMAGGQGKIYDIKKMS